MDLLLFVGLASIGGEMMRKRGIKRKPEDAFELYHIGVQTQGSGRLHQSHISRRTVKSARGNPRTYYRYY